MPQPKERQFDSNDYWNLPEGRRAELIDGVLYDMTPPGRAHQKLSSGISHALHLFIDEHGGPCEVYYAPFAVNLDADDTVWVEPDVTVICDTTKLSDRGCEGAPDLVVEIVSPSSRRMDYITKLFRYERAGVREYWIVDPGRRCTTVYRFEPDGPGIQVYPFDQPVPAGIYDGALTVKMGDFL